MEFEFEGKTKEEAIEKACKELNVPKDKLEIEVIESGSSGIFGIVGGRKSRIKVKIKEENDYFQDVLSFAKEALENMLRIFDINGLTVKAKITQGNILLNIEGDDSGILIGKGGRTLDALEFLINKMVNRKFEKKLQIIVDSQNYRERKRGYLRKLAIDMRNRAKKSGKPVSTEPLSPKDRRIIHIALKDDKEIETRSTGEGFLRKVLVIPKASIKNKRGQVKANRHGK